MQKTSACKRESGGRKYVLGISVNRLWIHVEVLGGYLGNNIIQILLKKLKTIVKINRECDSERRGTCA